MNTLYFGDNLKVMRDHLKDESVDLIYLDPPFNSKADYNVLFAEHDGTRAAAQMKAFSDTWRWDDGAVKAYCEIVEAGGRVAEAMQAFHKLLGGSDMLAYLCMMAPRLVELRRLLRPTGSIYLHCDPTASHYLKVLLDAALGPVNFRNELIWRRTNAHNKLTRQYGPIHDSILFYGKTRSAYFEPKYRPYTKAYIEDRFTHFDARGRYQPNYLTGPGVRKGHSGKPWRGFDPTASGRHWAVPRSLREFLPDDTSAMTSQDMLEALYMQDYIIFPAKEGGQPMYKQYMGPGVVYQDIWAYQPNTSGVLYGTDECIDEDVKWLEAEDEKLGFETQKPLGLLARIIRSSSKPGDVILDPFCGCGTTIEAAQNLERQWVGIDITHLAITLIRNRLRDAFGDQVRSTYQVVGQPTTFQDAEALALEDRYQFQYWALSEVSARPVERKKGADQGIDGKLLFHDDPKGGDTRQIILSVKSGAPQVKDVRDLRGVIEREEAEIGVVLTLYNPTRPMRVEAAGAGLYRSQLLGTSHPRIQILTIPDLLAGQGIDYPMHSTNITFRQAPRAVAPPKHKDGVLIEHVDAQPETGPED